MRVYVMTTGVIFGLITLAHIWRAVVEGPGMATNLWFILLTVLAAGLCVWAVRLLLKPRD
jgi:tetrahydromethanopterin S-methyltransferase subunit E